MLQAATNYVRSIEDSRHMLGPLLRLLVQKKAVRPEDAELAIVAAMRKAQEAIQAQLVTFLIFDSASERFRALCMHLSSFLHRSGTLTRSKVEEIESHYRNSHHPAGETVALSAMSKKETIVLTGIEALGICATQALKECGYEVESLVAVPVIDGNIPVACVEAINRLGADGRVSLFSEEDQQLIEDVANYCGKVLRRSLHPEEQVPEREKVLCLARLAHCEAATLPLKANDDLINAIGITKLRQYHILPLKRISKDTISGAISNPLDVQNISDFEIASGYRVAQKYVASESGIIEALDKATPAHSEVMREAAQIAEEYDALESVVTASELVAESNENSALIIRLVNRTIEDAYQSGASDIHIEAAESDLVIRYRIDGVCRKKLALPKAAQRAIVTRLKIMSDLDIAEHRVPQDGKIVFKKFSPNCDVDLRVSVAPMNYGESVVLRLLDKKRSTLPLDKLGFSNYNLKLYRETIQAPYGMVLHCGPTGSGKSMTLYAALNEINTPEWKICTAEDPIEYTLPGINQLQVKRDVGLTFASALRCFLRQDPDIILVGEIRDKETAEIAIEAALTGHLLFSTLHTNDACSTVTRLVEIGIEPFLIANTLIAVCAQRLVRRLCPCKHSEKPKDADLRRLRSLREGAVPELIYVPVGCEKCERCGYKGRTGIHEMMVFNDEMRDLLTASAPPEQIKVRARLNGMRTLFEDAMEKVAFGISSMTEVLTIVRVDETPFEALGGLAESAKFAPAETVKIGK